jgi:steroid delta-isomerase-like uncharacterized protein
MNITSKTTAANKALVSKFFNYFETGSTDRIVNELLSPSYTLNFPGKSAPLSPSDTKSLMTEYVTAFPNLKFSITEQVTEGEKVVTCLTVSGTHTGKYMGMNPTGKTFTVSAITVHRIVNEKIEEEWTELNVLGIIHQLGLLAETNQIATAWSSSPATNS